MSIEVKVPVLPESVSDAIIATWHKKVGDSVRRDENLIDLETDKVVLEVPSPVDGVLKEIKFETGATVTSAQVIAVIEEGAVAAAPAPAAPVAKADAPQSAAPASRLRQLQQPWTPVRNSRRAPPITPREMTSTLPMSPAPAVPAASPRKIWSST